MGKVVVAILVLAVVAGVTITSTTHHPRADFRFIDRVSVNTLDPAQMSYMQDIRLAVTLWEGLTTLDPQTLAPREGVAYFPPRISDDRRTYTFTLRPEARWSNGDPVTAEDFVRGWRRAIEPGSCDVYAESIYLYIDGAREYSAWRLETTALLALVRQLQKDSPISAEAVRDGLITATGRQFARKLGLTVPEPPPGETDAVWPRLVLELRALKTDWGRLGDSLLDEDIREMEMRWDRVGVRAIDDHHVEMRLVRPTSFFFDLTSFTTYLPTHRSIERLREGYAGRSLTESGLWAYDEQWTKPDYHRNGYPGLITNGPYRLAAWDFKQRLRMEPNPCYWRKEVAKSGSMEFVDCDYPNTAWMLYDQGRVDLLCDMSMDYVPELIRQVREGKRNDIHPVPSFGTQYYSVNCRPRLWDGRANPLADARVRRALALAINKQDFVDHVERLGNPVSNTLVPVGQISGYRSPAGLRCDPPRARQELAAAGYPGGRGLPVIEILYDTGSGHEVPAQAIARMWDRELGIACRLVGKETKTFAEDKLRGRFMISRSGWFGDYTDPTTFLNLVRSTDGHNSAGFSDAKFDGMLEAAADESDAARRLDLLSEAEQYLMEEQLPLLPLCTYVMVLAWHPEVAGVYPNPRQLLPLYCIHVGGR